MNAYIYGIFAQTVPDGEPAAPGDLGDKLNKMVGYAKYLGFGIAVLALIAAAAKLALDSHEGRGGGGAGGMAKVFLAVAVIAGAPSLVALMI